MPWNWQLPAWPKFSYDKNRTLELEKKFLLKIGRDSAFLKNLNKSDSNEFIVEILSSEGIDSSKIEGEILDRQSLQSSIKKHFGLKEVKKKEKESRVAKLLINVYKTFDRPLTHKMLFEWHKILFEKSSEIDDIGQYRTQKNRSAAPNQVLARSKDITREIYIFRGYKD